MLPLHPHLKWGGTSCPGRRWPEWVPQLRSFTAQEEDMARLDNEDKEYLAGLMRGVLWAVADGQMNSALKQGAPDWRPSRSLRDLLDAIPSVTGNGGLGEAQVRQIVRQEIDKTKLTA